MAMNNARLARLYDIEARGEWNNEDRAYISRVIRALVAECVELAEVVIDQQTKDDATPDYDLEWYARQALKNIDKVL